MFNSHVWLLLLLWTNFMPERNRLYAAREFRVDLERSDVCSASQAATVSQFDIYNVFAEPRQDNQGIRDSCTVRFTGDGGRRLKLYVRDLLFKECQVFIKIYDGPVESVALNTPRETFGCTSGAGASYNSLTDQIAISLQKADSRTTGYKFYIRVATVDGPSFGDTVPEQPPASGMTGGVIAGIVVAGVLVLVVFIAGAVYLLMALRRKQEEKEAIARSTSILFPTGSVNGSVHSAHSSVHGSVHSSKHSMYPAFRSTITEKRATCNSIDTRSEDTDQVDRVEKDVKPKAVKNVSHEFDSMRRGLARERYMKAREEEDLKEQEALWQEHQRADKQSRMESRRGLGRTNRAPREDTMRLTDANIKQSLREARQRGRSFDDMSSHKGSTRSSKGRHRPHHSPARSVPTFRSGRADSDYDYPDVHSETNYRDSRSRTRSQSGRSHRASSVGSTSHRRRTDDRDTESDYENRRRRDHYDDRDRFSEDDRHSRSGTRRPRSYSQGSRRR